MRIILDLEANGLEPTVIHCIVCKDIDNERTTVFSTGRQNLSSFPEFAKGISYCVGHNILGYDLPALRRLCGVDIPLHVCLDTLVLSRLLDESRPGGHSLEAWGQTLGRSKVGVDITDWSVWTQEMEDRCVADVEINYLLFKRFEKYVVSPRWQAAITTEHFIAAACRTLHENGFAFDLSGAIKLKTEIDHEVQKLDDELQRAFPPRSRLVRECTPRATKFGTINRTSVPRGTEDFTQYVIGATFSVISFEPFNPASPTQIVERLNEAGWKPTEKTKGHKEAEKEHRSLVRKRKKTVHDFERLYELTERLKQYAISGWSISEENLRTLPDTAPLAAHSLARRLLLGSRSSTLGTWINAARREDNGEYRIHGSFTGIGAWTHRMSHSNPNQGNIPKFDAKQPAKTPYSDKMRSLWRAGLGRWLVGVDAESIQLRIFAHYIDDLDFVNALISGKKEDGTDPHSLNWRALGPPCKSRDDAKTFVYAFLLGAGNEKVSQILGCSKAEAIEAKENFIKRYPGLEYLKKEVIPFDAARGYFEGFDGRLVKIWGEDEDQKEHFTLAGYLQNGEAVIMKRAAQIWYPKLKKEGIPFWWVNFVHDEYQTETPQDREIAEYVARTQADSIRQVGVDLGLRCPMAGSILSAHGKIAIGDTWLDTH